MLALTLLMRNWRSGELKLLSASIVLAVAVLSGISLFADRLESTLLNQSNTILGADNIVKSSKPFTQEWIDTATRENLLQAHTIEFSSMAYAGDEMHLAAIKAVSPNYPLRGQLDISQVPFTMIPSDIHVANGVPARGEVWIDSRLFPQLHINVGDKMAVGELELTVAHVLIHSPESTSFFSAFAPRVLMNIDDVAATQVTQQGSVVEYTWMLASDNPTELEKFISDLKPKLSKHEKIVDLASSQERLSNTLNSGKNFLLLAAVIAVLLAGVSIAIAARQFSERHTNQVALMKSLGASTLKIRTLYFSQLLLLGALASFFGLLVGYGLQSLLVVSLQKTYQLALQPAHIYPYLFSFLSGLVCLVFFALPALWFLPAIPPLKILRRELAINVTHVGFQSVAAFFAVIVLVALFSQDFMLTLSVAGALVAVILISSLFSAGLLLLSKKIVMRLGGFWRLAFSNLQRRKGQSLIQIMVFSIAIMLLLTLTIVRTSLIDDWKRQLPVNAPNHFLVNIPPSELQDVKSMLQEKNLLTAQLYPMIRGRLVKINGIEPSEELTKKANALQREINLTQSDVLADDNKILEGEWWGQWNKTELSGVSVESETAKNLQLRIGDKLQFSLGGLILDAQIASIRSLDWKSMRPNFFFIFEPHTLDAYSPTFMTSIYLSAEQKVFINQLLRKHPTILVMEFDRVLEQMRNIVNQVSDGIQWVLLLTLVAGSMVLFAAVMSSIDSRKQEAGLLRALGCSRQLVLGSVFVEFMIVGLLAGFIAIIGAETLLLSLQKFSLQPHYMYWILSPLISAAFISALGVFCCRPILSSPPAVVLREAA